MEGYPENINAAPPIVYQMPIPSAPPQTSEGVIKESPPIRKIDVVVVDNNPEPQRRRRRGVLDDPRVRNTGLRCGRVNHCAYAILTFFTSGFCLPCWIGACFGFCPTCNFD